MNESFWDAQGVEIEACADFMFFCELANILLVSIFFANRMLWASLSRIISMGGTPQNMLENNAFRTIYFGDIPL